uniref:Uncharacterized protein n=1 Tax=Timema shepardi TaxID=629360 RepID=A0A7R9G0J5_TIMSH|nr:unnamed protein product [Timema shepardi]
MKAGQVTQSVTVISPSHESGIRLCDRPHTRLVPIWLMTAVVDHHLVHPVPVLVEVVLHRPARLGPTFAETVHRVVPVHVDDVGRGETFQEPSGVGLYLVAVPAICLQLQDRPPGEHVAVQSTSPCISRIDPASEKETSYSPSAVVTEGSFVQFGRTSNLKVKRRSSPTCCLANRCTEMVAIPANDKAKHFYTHDRTYEVWIRWRGVFTGDGTSVPFFSRRERNTDLTKARETGYDKRVATNQMTRSPHTLHLDQSREEDPRHTF